MTTTRSLAALLAALCWASVGLAQDPPKEGAEINDRTEELDDIRARLKEKGGITAAQEQELSRLENDQRSIADLARDLTRPKRDDGEED